MEITFDVYASESDFVNKKECDYIEDLKLNFRDIPQVGQFMSLVYDRDEFSEERNHYLKGLEYFKCKVLGIDVCYDIHCKEMEISWVDVSVLLINKY